jgi:hypothetical protein
VTRMSLQRPYASWISGGRPSSGGGRPVASPARMSPIQARSARRAITIERQEVRLEVCPPPTSSLGRTSRCLDTGRFPAAGLLQASSAPSAGGPGTALERLRVRRGRPERFWNGFGTLAAETESSTPEPSH